MRSTEDIESSIDQLSKLVPEWASVLSSSRGRLLKIVGAQLSSQDVHRKLSEKLREAES